MRGTFDKGQSDALHRLRASEPVESHQMHSLAKLLVGTLVCATAAACSAEAEPEPTVAPLQTAEVASILPTAVPPDGPPGQVGDWAIPFSYEFPAGTWHVGFHRYALRVDCPILAQESLAGEWRDFVVTKESAPINTPIFLRLGGLSTGTLGPPGIQTIHPDQLTIALVTILGVTEEQALAAAASQDCEVVVVWDGGAEELSPAEPYRP